MNVRDYKIIEHRFNINVNVFGCNNRVFPIYVSEKNNDQVLNALLISNKEKSHYVFIKDFNKLLCSQTGTKNQHKNIIACIVYKILLLKKYWINIKNYAH